MRLLADFDDARQAELLRDALYARHIASDVKPGRDGRHGLWVHDEQQLDLARDLSEGWLRGDGKALATAAREGRQLRAEAERRAARADEQARRARQAARPASGGAPLTYGVIALCVALHMLRASGFSDAAFGLLAIMDPRQDIMGTPVQLGPWQLVLFPLPWSEPWRFVTPILMHHVPRGGGVFALFSLHLIFNMVMMGSLGPSVERRHGSLYLGAFILVSGALSNVAQYEISASLGFLGISGVVYGLIGFSWLGQRLDRSLDYGVSDGFFQFAMIWMLLGFLDFTGQVGLANWCHLGGLVVGLAWAYVANRLRR